MIHGSLGNRSLQFDAEVNLLSWNVPIIQLLRSIAGFCFRNRSFFVIIYGADILRTLKGSILGNEGIFKWKILFLCRRPDKSDSDSKFYLL